MVQRSPESGTPDNTLFDDSFLNPDQDTDTADFVDEPMATEETEKEAPAQVSELPPQPPVAEVPEEREHTCTCAQCDIGNHCYNEARGCTA